jgi:putative membrane protein
MLGLIVSREFTALLKSKAMRVSTAIVVALMLIGGGVAGFLLGGKGVDVSIPPATGHTAQTNPLGFIVGMVAVMFVAIPIFMGMGALNSGVVEEKTSRVVEIILTTVKPRTLLLAKLLGIGSAMLVFIACYLAGIVAGAGLAGVLPSMGNLAAAHLNPWTFAPAVLVWLAVGYFTFGGLSGALASTVSRQEDLGAVQTPVIFGAMIPMYVALYLVPYAPDTTVTHILSCCPFLSPFMMPMRMALGAVGVWEQLLAFAVQIATICLLSLLAGKVYERSILHTGERLKLRQALRGR